MNTEKAHLDEFNKKLPFPIGDEELLKRVFTHRSYLNESGEEGLESNERLEFLGDSVLSTVISRMLFKRFTELDEGGLTRLRARLVNTRALAEAALRMRMNEFLLLGRGEAASGGAENQTILAGTFEALLAAVYIDSGAEESFSFIEGLFKDQLDDSLLELVHFDYKPALQELSQSTFKAAPEYRLTGESGPPHKRVFDVEVAVNGEVLGRGTAGRKKDAEQAAAEEALKRLDKDV
jgi:ribonuclease-3